MSGLSQIKIGLLGLLGLAAIGCAPAADPDTDTLKLGAYSVVREVIHDGLIPAFAQDWKNKTGRAVVFEESYNASGAQARSIASGFDADLAILSHSGDMRSLVDAGRVKQDWDAGPDHGLITKSLVVIGHREGNPKGIHELADLAQPGLGVLYPDPKTSGGAKWNINAIYGAALLAAKQAGDSDPAANAGALLAKVQANVVNMDPSGRQSVATFERGTGDALVTYENELLLRKREGKEIPYVVPESTLIIEGPAALVETSIERHGTREVAEAFLEFLRSEKGRAIFAEYGYRPVSGEAPTPLFPPLPAKAFTIDDLGGWDALEQELYRSEGRWTTIFTKLAKDGG
jgi:sulfate/thiosulfate transport system substrate-binding protein